MALVRLLLPNWLHRGPKISRKSRRWVQWVSSVRLDIAYIVPGVSETYFFSCNGYGMWTARCHKPVFQHVNQTMSSISSFMLAMCMHPDAQAKAQEEIDRVVGKDRLPTFEDRRSLPYVEAVYREVMRLDPPIPLGKISLPRYQYHYPSWNARNLTGFPHTSTEDDFYCGYHIPKGSTFIWLSYDQHLTCTS